MAKNFRGLQSVTLGAMKNGSLIEPKIEGVTIVSSDDDDWSCNHPVCLNVDFNEWGWDSYVKSTLSIAD
jgi:hypothetical protein